MPINKSIKNIVLLSFALISLYLWVLVPAIRICLTPILGQDTAESIAFSMMMFHRVDVFFSLQMPTTMSGCLLYYLNRACELIAFVTSLSIILCFGKGKSKIPLIIVAVTTVLVCGVLAAWARKDDPFGWILPMVASTSGIVVGIFGNILKRKEVTH